MIEANSLKVNVWAAMLLLLFPLSLLASLFILGSVCGVAFALLKLLSVQNKMLNKHPIQEINVHHQTYSFVSFQRNILYKHFTRKDYISKAFIYDKKKL